jgi:hypothetical protein
VSGLALSLLLATLWTDHSGRVSCAVPAGFAPVGENRFASGDERLVYVPFVYRTTVGSAAELSGRMLASIGLPPPSGNDPSAAAVGPVLAASVAAVPASDGWGGAMVIGLPNDSFLWARAQQAAADCHIAPPAAPSPPLVAGGRILDGSRRLSLALPPGTEGFELGGSGAARGYGFQIYLVAPPANAETLEQRAQELVAQQGATPSPAFPGSAGLFRAAVSTGSASPYGRSIFVEAVVIDAGGAPVAAVLVADAAAQLAGQQTLSLMLSSAAPGGAP